jgi:hypothetical protein
MDPDPDPAIFVIDLQDASKKLIFQHNFSAYYFLKVHLHQFSKIKSQKESQNSRNQGFSYYFCMMIEGSGSIPLTSGSGSGSWRPKNMWIRIRIRNTGLKECNTLLQMFSLFAQAQHDVDGRRGNAAELPLDRGPGLPGGGRLEARRSSPSAQRPDNSHGSNNSSPVSGKNTKMFNFIHHPMYFPYFI